MAKITGYRQAFLEGFIEDELISIFGRLSIDTQIWIGVEPVRMHPDLQKIVAAIVQSIPTTQRFPDLTSARKYFDILMYVISVSVLTFARSFVILARDRISHHKFPSNQALASNY